MKNISLFSVYFSSKILKKIFLIVFSVYSVSLVKKTSTLLTCLLQSFYSVKESKLLSALAAFFIVVY